jgi:hypothetical protein
MNSIITYSISLRISLNFRAASLMESNFKQSLHPRLLNLKNTNKVSSRYKNFSMLIPLDIKDLGSLDNKWCRIIIKHKCFMVIFNAARMMSPKKKIPINRFLKRAHNFQMILALKILKKKENRREKIQMKIKWILKLQVKISVIKKNNVSYSFLNVYLFKFI